MGASTRDTLQLLYARQPPPWANFAPPPPPRERQPPAARWRWRMPARSSTEPKVCAPKHPTSGMAGPFACELAMTPRPAPHPGPQRRWLGFWARQRRGSRRPAIDRLGERFADSALGWGLREGGKLRCLACSNISSFFFKPQNTPPKGYGGCSEATAESPQIWLAPSPGSYGTEACAAPRGAAAVAGVLGTAATWVAAAGNRAAGREIRGLLAWLGPAGKRHVALAPPKKRV
jgi:hypothetical protein